MGVFFCHLRLGRHGYGSPASPSALANAIGQIIDNLLSALLISVGNSGKRGPDTHSVYLVTAHTDFFSGQLCPVGQLVRPGMGNTDCNQCQAGDDGMY